MNDRWDYVPDFVFKVWWGIKCRLGHHYDPLPDGTCSSCERKVR